ncbi:MAG: N-acetylglutaminylglutamine synthetase, partial [Rickettsiales bacterium]|nr:N-acetylglutaminylglutamine synthetase [Rickettsiales bacterium]
MKADTRRKEKFDPTNSPSLKNWGEALVLPKENVVVECGWGRIVFAQTFKSNTAIADILRDEKEGYRDIAFYLRDPQVVIAKAPQELFIDPSYTYRLWLEDYAPEPQQNSNFTIREIDPSADVEVVNQIYQSRNMVSLDVAFLQETYKGRFIKYWVAVDNKTDKPIGVGMSVDHKRAFSDPEYGVSVWAVAVDPQAKYPGVGIALLKHMAAHFKEKKRQFIDVSVLHDNQEAIQLYEKLGFHQVPVFCIKNKNAINEKLFSGPQPEEALNPYATIIVNEARRRGIKVEVLDAVDNYFQLSYGGRTITCRESLSELTSSIAMSRCSDKQTTHRLLSHAGLSVPPQQLVTTPAQNLIFLEAQQRIVVKPAVGEQGAGITIDVTTKNELAHAITYAQRTSHKVILEKMVSGQDLRIVVIGFEVVAAAIRKPPVIIGDGKHTVLELIKKACRRREKATGGESKIPLDQELERTVTNQGYSLDDILPPKQELMVRKTANLHTGGTIHDVTDQLHPR